MSMNRLVMAVTSASAAGLITGLVLIGTSLLRDDVVDQPASSAATQDAAVDVLGVPSTTQPVDTGGPTVTQDAQPAAVAPPPAQEPPPPAAQPSDPWPPSVINGTITHVGVGCYTVTADDGQQLALHGTDGSIPVGSTVEVGVIPGGAPATPCAGPAYYYAYINVR